MKRTGMGASPCNCRHGMSTGYSLKKVRHTIAQPPNNEHISHIGRVMKEWESVANMFTFVFPALGPFVALPFLTLFAGELKLNLSLIAPPSPPPPPGDESAGCATTGERTSGDPSLKTNACADGVTGQRGQGRCKTMTTIQSYLARKDVIDSSQTRHWQRAR